MYVPTLSDYGYNQETDACVPRLQRPSLGGNDEKTEEQENVTIDVEQPPTSDNTEVESSPSTLSFNDVDTAVDTDKNEYNINAPIDKEITETKVPIHWPNNIPEIIKRGAPNPRRATQITAKIKKYIMFVIMLTLT